MSWRPLVVGLCLVVLVACSAPGSAPQAEAPEAASGIIATSTTQTLPVTTTTTPSTTTTPAPTTTTTLVAPDGLTAAERSLTLTGTITGDISPKSVVASSTGLFFAQNMMYRHTITVYDRSLSLLATIPDRVEPASFGHEEFTGEYLGSPVEAAFDSDGSHAYVSNYKMYGGGLDTSAGDGCNAGGWPDSFVYRVDTDNLQIEDLIRVGPVPKFLAVTPNDRYLLVANWCGFDVSVIHLPTLSEVTRVPVGRHPRGIAVTPDSKTAFVAVMGSTALAKIDLVGFAVEHVEGVGRSPRHLVISPDGSTLYVTLNGEGRIAKLDLATESVVAKVATGAAPRSMTISEDGTALYVVNYNSNTMSKVRTADMVELEEHRTAPNPIGITYDPDTRQVWVSNYSGTIQVFSDG